MVQAVSVAQEVSNVPFSHEVVGLVQPVVEVQNVWGVIPMSHGLILAGILFAIGLCGVMVRRNFLFMLMSLEIMMNAAALAFVVAGSRWVDPDGQIMFIFILTLAAAEASIGLAILLQFYHKRGHLDVDSANEMKG
jgi:NADH-quinone oxidoreductase subunit K